MDEIFTPREQRLIDELDETRNRYHLVHRAYVREREERERERRDLDVISQHNFDAGFRHGVNAAAPTLQTTRAQLDERDILIAALRREIGEGQFAAIVARLSWTQPDDDVEEDDGQEQAPGAPRKKRQKPSIN